MCGKDVGKVYDKIEDVFSLDTGGGNSAFQSMMDIGLNLFTYGQLGFKADEGGVGYNGVIGQAIKDTAKDVTGATAAEEANKLAREQAEEARAQGLKDRADAQSRNAADQLAASRQAGALRTGGLGSSTGSSTITNIGADERDFLGL